MNNLPYPSMTAQDESGRYLEIRRYLFRLVETLNAEFSSQSASGLDDAARRAISDTAAELRAQILTNQRDTERRFDSIADSVTDVSTTNSTGITWTLRKWESGLAECWGTWSGTLTGGTTVGGFTPYTATVTLPSGLFTEAPEVITSGNVGTGTTIQGGTGTLSTASVEIIALSTLTGSQNCKFAISVKGRWT